MLCSTYLTVCSASNTIINIGGVMHEEHSEKA